MRRFRNPKYAPEALERRLHPSGFAIPVTAEVASSTPTGGTATAHPGGFTCAAYDPPPAPPTDPDPDPCPTPIGHPGCPQDPDEPN